MDKAKTRTLVYCPDHDEPLSRVNPERSAVKHVRCLECLIQAKDVQGQYLNFPKIVDFIATAAATFAQQKSQVTPSEVPKEFLEAAARQAESLEKFSKHLDREKKKIETFFANISNVIIDALDQLKNEHLEVLDKQVANLHEVYTTFEKRLKRYYPKMEDVEMMFPTKEELESRLEKIGSAADLNDFFKELKQGIELNKNDGLFIKSSDEMKLNYFTKFSNKLKEIENDKPTFEEKELNSQEAKNKIKKHLHQILDLEKIFTLKNPISTDLAKLNVQSINYPQSTIINSKDFEILEDWVPNNIKFNPALLYRLTRDGKSSQTFHSLCDKKGPTITIIRCKYDDASQTSIIGGFSDIEFDKNGKGWASSNQAFIFSLNEKGKIKCPILQPRSAFYNGDEIDINFGPNGTIGIKNNFESCHSYIYDSSSGFYTYADSFKIVPSESLTYNEAISFKIEELEVYAVSKLN